MEKNEIDVTICFRADISEMAYILLYYCASI